MSRICKIALVFNIIFLINKTVQAQVDFEKLEEYKQQLVFIADFRLQNKDSALVLAYENLELAKETNSPWAISKAHTQIGLILRNLYRYEESVEFHEKALEFSKASDSVSLKPDLLNDLALAVISIDQDQRSINLRLESIPIYKQIQDYDGLSNAYYNLGYDYKYSGNTDSAVYYLEAAAAIGDQYEIDDLYILSYNVLGNIRSDQGRYLEALDYQQLALKRAEETDNKAEIATVSSNVAILYKNLEDYSRAEESYLKSIRISEELGRDDVHFSHFNIAIMYSELSDYEKAKKHFLKAFELRVKVGEKRYMLTGAVMLADLYQIIGIEDSCNVYINYATSLIDQVNSKSSRASAFEVLGNINMNRGNLELAKVQLTKGYDLYKELGYNDALYEAAYSLYNLYSKLGDSELAIGFLEKYIQVKDSVVSEEQIMAITRLDEGYKHDKELLQKQSEITLLESKEQIANLQITLLVVGILVISLLGFFIARHLLMKKERKKRELEEIGQFKEAMTGMIAHDLKNPLGIILGTESEKPSTRLMARQMLNLVNNMLDVHKFERTSVILDISIFELNKLISEATEQVRPLMSEKNLSIKNAVDSGCMVRADYEYLLRIFVNLFTNAIKYSPNNDTIEVSSSRSLNDKLAISVKDHGAGIARENIHKIFENFGQVNPRKSGGVGSTGLGLSFCQLAVRAHGSELSVESELGKGTKFMFELEFIEYGKSQDTEINPEMVFTMSEEERKVVILKISELKELKLHQAFAIEEILESIEVDSDAISNWSERVLNAAYANNESHFRELLEMVESPN